MFIFEVSSLLQGHEFLDQWIIYRKQSVWSGQRDSRGSRRGGTSFE